MTTKHSTRVLASFLFAGAACSIGCGTAPSESKLAYAHKAAEDALGSVYSRYWLKKNGKLSGPMRICLQVPPADSISREEFLLEAKLAYVAWFQQISGVTAEDLAAFEFVMQDECRQDDTSFESLTRIVPKSETELLKKYQIDPIDAECTRKGGRIGCKTKGSSRTGVGGTGVLRDYNGFQNQHAANAELSPFVEWMSIRESIRLNRDIEPRRRKQIYDSYQSLLQEADMTGLMQFNELLWSSRARSSEQNNLASAMSRFRKMNTDKASFTITPRYSMYHVLLHEVGHQFGMVHADDPADGSVTGTVGDAERNDEGLFETERATMAYHVPYLYLTLDDQAGIKSMAKALAEYLKGF